MITLGKNQVEMSTNQKVKEMARYNSDSCSVAISQLIRNIIDASDEGNLGIPSGPGTNARGIAYAPSTTSDPPAVEFAKKAVLGLETNTCEDVSFSPADIALDVQTASGGSLVIDPSWELDAAADLRSKVTQAEAGTASREYAAGQGHGLGEGGAGGGGMVMKFVLACRGKAPNNALHVGYSVYRKRIGH
jgi:hypothetical protein